MPGGVRGLSYAGPAHSSCSTPVKYTLSYDGQQERMEWENVCLGSADVAAAPSAKHQPLKHQDMVVTDITDGVEISFSNRRNPEAVTAQKVKRTGVLRGDSAPNVEVHLLDSGTRAVFQFRMLLTGNLLRRWASSDELRVFEFRHFHTVGISTRGNVPTLWQGCVPPLPDDYVQARFSMVDCQPSLGKHFSDMGFMVAVSAISRELWTVPKRDSHGELCNCLCD